MEYPRISTDTEGVWRIDESGNKYGIRWNEIHRISGYKLDVITQVDTVIELDFEFGEFLELNSEFPGFFSAVKQFSSYIPNLPDHWFSLIDQLNAEQDALVVWQREVNA
jgi:hypothetical protein